MQVFFEGFCRILQARGVTEVMLWPVPCCHPERSEMASEANHLAQSKDPASSNLE
jgi:hypothetical protein